ncbi:hypothetical protein AB0M22_05760 [Nocardia sp. NPDC051756]|uniref:hypothetical protein n=1 Tax=Nocardia sp. NPDC051756 TaxID=3154751 RepID=UPI00342C417B
MPNIGLPEPNADGRTDRHAGHTRVPAFPAHFGQRARWPERNNLCGEGNASCTGVESCSWRTRSRSTSGWQAVIPGAGRPLHRNMMLFS